LTALTFNAVWQYTRRNGLVSKELDATGATAISRRFQLALAWLSIGALLGAALPVLGVAVRFGFRRRPPRRAIFPGGRPSPPFRPA